MEVWKGHYNLYPRLKIFLALGWSLPLKVGPEEFYPDQRFSVNFLPHGSSSDF